MMVVKVRWCQGGEHWSGVFLNGIAIVKVPHRISVLIPTTEWPFDWN
jgi:hypothetical protein